MLLSEIEEIPEQLTCYHKVKDNIRNRGGFNSETLRSFLKNVASCEPLGGQKLSQTV